MLIMGKKSTVLILVLIGVVLISIGSGILITNKVKMDKYVKTQALVVGHKVSGGESSIGFDEDDEVKFAEVVQYLTPQGLMTAQNPYYSNNAKDIGQTIEIAYDPDNPSKCIFVNSHLEICIFLIVFGAVFLIVAILMAVLFRRAKDGNSDIISHID